MKLTQLINVTFTVFYLNIAASVSAITPNPDELLVWQIQEHAGPSIFEQAANRPELADFLKTLYAHEAWMRELLDSGPIENGPRTLTFLAQLWNEDPDLANRSVDRSMATACALELRKDRLDDSWMRDRYHYFRDHFKDGLLNNCYPDLATWERRFLARGAQYPSYTAVEALEFLRERICWPRSEYVRACWQAPYRGFNCFDDTVQGWLYYHPFRESFRCDPEMAIEVGGVCGALSNTGASAAIANGIPAFTMGEPGHCAYAVQTAPGQWTPAYSLSWKRSLHSSLQRPNWASHVLVQRAFERTTNHQQASDQKRLAHWHDQQGSTQQAEVAYLRALERNHLDEGLWRDYLQFGLDHQMDRRWWERTMTKLHNQLLPAHPEPVWALSKQYIYPELFKGMPANKRIAYLGRYLRNVQDWGPVRWNIEPALDWMLKNAGDPREQQQFLIMTLRNLIDSPDLGAPYIAWAMNKLKDDPDGNAMFERVLLGEANSAGDGQDAALRQLARTMLPAAAEANDLETFQRIGRAASRLHEPRTSLAESGIEPFQGRLLSQGGALRIWEPGNRWDSPEQHWGVLEERGGQFHTQVGDQPWFEIELPHFGEIEGIILEGRRGQQHRAKDARILVSRDGIEWEQVATLEGAHLWYRVDLSDTKPRGRFIRVERDGKCMHFPRVLIYGKRTS